MELSGIIVSDHIPACNMQQQLQTIMTHECIVKAEASAQKSKRLQFNWSLRDVETLIPLQSCQKKNCSSDRIQDTSLWCKSKFTVFCLGTPAWHNSHEERLWREAHQRRQHLYTNIINCIRVKLKIHLTSQVTHSWDIVYKSLQKAQVEMCYRAPLIQIIGDVRLLPKLFIAKGRL